MRGIHNFLLILAFSIFFTSECMVIMDVYKNEELYEKFRVSFTQYDVEYHCFKCKEKHDPEQNFESCCQYKICP